ncbi:zinc finger matrin-type protein 5-like protein [Dinothrombium tinctorium]|uniref:Zinc finger matrin-type protein 5-like protein n=1 Tax=Dinothrombium tinctorium TaxID=1965070 RepID=A0A443RLG8_9ACAR|nr:zinc finger matrin-type protein 5-like protein [Dinothrombium tinctorium]
METENKMGKVFYCEYCERSFKDCPKTRKTHLKSNEHKANVHLYNQQFKDEIDILKEEVNKTACHFFQKGACRYGEQCLNSHLTVEKFDHLKAKVFSKIYSGHLNMQSLASSEFVEIDPQKHLSIWLQQRNAPQDYDLFSEFSNIDFNTLPPSLIPPKIEHFEGISCDWN